MLYLICLLNVNSIRSDAASTLFASASFMVRWTQMGYLYAYRPVSIYLSLFGVMRRKLLVVSVYNEGLDKKNLQVHSDDSVVFPVHNVNADRSLSCSHLI